MAKKVAQDFRQQWRELTPQIIARAREEVYNLYCKVFWKGIQISCLRKGWAFLQCVVIIMCFMIQGRTQSSPDSVPEGDSLTQALGRVPTPQPCILIKGTLQEIEDSVLVIEKNIITVFPPTDAAPLTDAPLVLLGAFYAYNMHYTVRCKNFYTFFEVFF